MASVRFSGLGMRLYRGHALHHALSTTRVAVAEPGAPAKLVAGVLSLLDRSGASTETRTADKATSTVLAVPNHPASLIVA